MDTIEELQTRVALLTTELGRANSKLLVSHFMSKYGKSTSVRMKHVIELLYQLGLFNE